MARSFSARAGSIVPTVVALAISVVLIVVNVARSPDIISDEATYALTGQHVINYNALTFGVVPIVVHPPLFFLTSGAWLALTGRDDASITSAITSLRYLDAIFCLGIVLFTALLGRAWLRDHVRTSSIYLAPLAMVLVAADGFLLRFGRAVLIEPMAIFLAVVAVYVCWRLRNARLPLYAAGAGIAIGLALLVKQPTLFIVATPLVASVLRLRLRAIGRELLAMIVALLVFASFPFWAYQSGNGDAFFNTQTLNVRRLFGLVQVTGLNRDSSKAAGGAASSVKDTFTQFAGAYVLFLAGAIAIALLAWQLVRHRRRDSLEPGKLQLLALGLLSYAFLAYSVLFGQSNQQLTMYTVPAAAILTTWLVLGHNPLERARRFGVAIMAVSTAVVGVGLIASLASGVAFYPLRDDNATVRVESYIRRNVPACVPVNTTGNGTHWSFTMRTNPVTGYASGPDALKRGTHLFLVSPRDAKYGYGPSSPEFNTWIRDNGRKLFEAPSNVYGSVSLWQVGTIREPSETQPSTCVPALRTPLARLPSPALRYLGFLAAAIGIVVVLAAAAALLARRRRTGRHAVAPPDDEPDDGPDAGPVSEPSAQT